MLQSLRSWGSSLEETRRAFNMDVCKRMTCINMWVLSQRHWARTCSVESGPAVVVGVVQHQHNGWSWFFRSWCMLCSDSSGCSDAGSRGASSCGDGSSCSGGNCSGGNGLSHTGLNGFQDHFGSSVLWLVFCDVLDREHFGRMVWEGREEECCQART